MSRNQVRFYNSIGFRLSAIIAVVIFLSVSILSVVNAQQSLSRETENYRALVRGAASAYAASVADHVVEQDRVATLSALRGVRELPMSNMSMSRSRTVKSWLSWVQAPGVSQAHGRSSHSGAQIMFVWTYRSSKVDPRLAVLACLSALPPSDRKYSAICL